MHIDVHCHLDQLTFEEQNRELKNHRVIGVAVNYQSGKNLLELQNQYPQNVKLCLGIHPEYPDFFHEYDLVEKQIRENKDRIAGIGEIGLPYFNLLNMNSEEKNRIKKKASELFENFVRLAAELNLPVNLHCIEDCLPESIKILKKYDIKNALFHWFEGDEKSLAEIKLAGWKISVSPDLLANADYLSHITTIAPQIRDIFTLESDGPWEYDGKRGVPSMIHDTASTLANIFHMTKQEILAIADKNAESVFG
jgi:TatD DNase family protein